MLPDMSVLITQKLVESAKEFSNTVRVVVSQGRKMYNGLGGRSRPLLAVRRTEAPKAVEIEAVSRGCFKSSWSLMRLERRRQNRPLTSRGFANNSKAF